MEQQSRALQPLQCMRDALTGALEQGHAKKTCLPSALGPCQQLCATTTQSVEPSRDAAVSRWWLLIAHRSPFLPRAMQDYVILRPGMELLSLSHLQVCAVSQRTRWQQQR